MYDVYFTECTRLSVMHDHSMQLHLGVSHHSEHTLRGFTAKYHLERDTPQV